MGGHSAQSRPGKQIARREIIAIGDDLNDVPLILARGGLGVAMGNAREEVKAIAKQRDRVQCG